MIEKKVVIQADIHGTMAFPDKKGTYPAILLLAGSGPVDRDGNGPKGKFQTNVYKELAHFFTGAGFITLRYDKRGTGQRRGNWMQAGLTDLIEDAKQALHFLRKQPNVEKVIVCGHSEGTIIATELAASMKPDGCMFLSGGVDNLMEALYHQRQLAYQELFALPGLKGWLFRKMKVDQKNEKKSAKLLSKMKSTDQDMIRVQLFFKQPAKWFREHDAYSTRNTLQQVTCPVFALHGEKDPLVQSDVLKELDQLVQGESEYHLIENMEHGLRVQTEPKSILKLKKQMKLILRRPLHEDGLAKMENWLKRYFKDGTAGGQKQA